MTKASGLKLRAHDQGDLEVLSALLQDALVPLVDMTFLRREKRFVMVANRFKWPEAQERPEPSRPSGKDESEDARFEDADESPAFERVNCGICFDRVLRARSQGIDREDQEQILSLLAITSGQATIDLHFAGGGVIQLQVSGIHCHLEDLGEGWPTRWRPSHEADQKDA